MGRAPIAAIVFFGSVTFFALRWMMRKGAASSVGWIVCGIALAMAVWSLWSEQSQFPSDPEFAISPYFLLLAAAPAVSVAVGAAAAQYVSNRGTAIESLDAAQAPANE